MKRVGLKAIAAGLALLMTANLAAPATAEAADKLLITSAGKNSKVLVITQDMVDSEGEIVLSGEDFDKVVLPADVKIKNFYVDGCEIGELTVEGGNSPKVQLWDAQIKDVTVAAPALIDENKAIAEYLEVMRGKENTAEFDVAAFFKDVRETNERLKKAVPDIRLMGADMESSKQEIGAVTLAGNAKVNFTKGTNPGKVNVAFDSAQAKMDVTIEGYKGDINVEQTSEKEGAFGILNINTKKSEIENVNVDAKGGANISLRTTDKSTAKNVNFDGAAVLTVDVPTENLKVDGEGATVRVLTDLISADIQGNGIVMDLGPAASVETTTVAGSGNAVTGSGDVKDVTIAEGSSASVQVPGANVTGNNSYKPSGSVGGGIISGGNTGGNTGGNGGSGNSGGNNGGGNNSGGNNGGGNNDSGTVVVEKVTFALESVVLTVGDEDMKLTTSKAINESEYTLAIDKQNVVNAYISGDSVYVAPKTTADVVTVALYKGSELQDTITVTVKAEEPSTPVPGTWICVIGWDGDEISKEILLGDVAAEKVDYIEFTADKDGAWAGYNKAGGGWGSTGDGKKEFTVSGADIDFSEKFFMKIGGATGTKVTWVIHEKSSSEELVPVEKKYTDITLFTDEGAAVTIDGASANIATAYTSVYVGVPEGIDVSKIQSVTVKGVNSEKLAVKLLDKDEIEQPRNWAGIKVDYRDKSDEFTIEFEYDASTNYLEKIAFMSLNPADDATAGLPLDVEVKEVTFVVLEEKTEGGGTVVDPTPEVTVTAVGNVTRELEVGATDTLEVTVTGTEEAVTWTSDATAVATVTANGKLATVEAVGAGTATVTATVGGKTVEFTVTVKGKEPTVVEDSVTINTKATTLTLDDTLKLDVTASDPSKVEYRTSDSDIADISQDGVVTPSGTKFGDVTVYATCGEAKASVVITVEKSFYAKVWKEDKWVAIKDYEFNATSANNEYSQGDTIANGTNLSMKNGDAHQIGAMLPDSVNDISLATMDDLKANIKKIVYDFEFTNSPEVATGKELQFQAGVADTGWTGLYPTQKAETVNGVLRKTIEITMDEIVAKELADINVLKVAVAGAEIGEDVVGKYSIKFVLNETPIQNGGSEGDAVTVAINEGDATIALNDTCGFTATVSSGATPIWTSSDPSIATVADNGVVTPVSNGTVTITASVGNVSDTVTVVVENAFWLSYWDNDAGSRIVTKNLAFTDKVFAENYGSVNTIVSATVGLCDYGEGENAGNGFVDCLPDSLKSNAELVEKVKSITGIMEVVKEFRAEVTITSGYADGIEMQPIIQNTPSYGGIYSETAKFTQEGDSYFASKEISTTLIDAWKEDQTTVSQCYIQLNGGALGETVSGTYSIKVVLK